MKLTEEIKNIPEEVKKILHLDESTGKVFVLNGACAIGHRVVERLIDKKYTNLRVGVRTLKEKETDTAIEFVPFVWEDEGTYEAALKDVKTVFVTIPIKPDDWDKHFPHFLKVCTENHVKKIVKLSFYHSIKPKAEHPSQAYGFPDYIAAHDGFHEVPLVHKHALCDGDLILHKELNETILFSSHLMSNIFRYGFDRKGLAEHHEFYGASGGKGVNYVSPNDVAEVAVHAILDKTHKRQAYTLTGPTITDEEIAKLLTDKIGTTVKYVEKPLSFFDSDTAMLEKIKASGLEENFPAGDVEKVLGKGPETFADYLLATDRMSPIEQDALAIHTPHHCHPKKEVTTKVVEGYEYLLGSRNIPADDEPGVEVAQ